MGSTKASITGGAILHTLAPTEAQRATALHMVGSTAAESGICQPECNDAETAHGPSNRAATCTAALAQRHGSLSWPQHRDNLVSSCIVAWAQQMNGLSWPKQHASLPFNCLAARGHQTPNWQSVA